MTVYQKTNLLLKAFIEADNQLSHLTRVISANRYLELGDDPHLIQTIETSMLQVERKIRSLESHFDLDKIPLSRANVYFSLIRNVRETLNFLQDVRKKNFGSQQYTNEFMEKLETCLDQLNAVASVMNTGSEIIQ